MSIKFTISDSVDTMTFDGGQAEIMSPLTSSPVIRETDVETIDSNISTYYAATKRQYTVDLGQLDRESYLSLLAFRTRQYENRRYPLITITGDQSVNVTDLPMKLTISNQQIINNCGDVEKVTLTLRESRQMV